MQIQISNHDGTPIYLQIVRQVGYLSASGRLASGEQLPPVRTLAEQLLVNPNTVARAYRELERSSVVVSRRGAGVFIGDGESPLSGKEKTRILRERIDALLTEARQLDVDLETLLQMTREQDTSFDQREGTEP